VTARKLAFVHELLTGLPKDARTNRELAPAF